MARARNIKPGFFTNDSLVELPFEVRLLFIGLWTIADKAGRLADRPKKIKMEIFPADEIDCDAALQLLAKSGFVVRYEVGGTRYIQIVNWSKHQNPHMKEADSVIPPPAPEIPVQTPESPVQTIDLTGASPSDSLIPDSLNPITTSSGKPSVPRFRDEAKEIIDFLNAKAGRRFRHVDANLKPIAARLKEGATVQDCKSIIARKVREWTGDPKTESWLTPETLFRPGKFEKYLGQLVEAPHE